MAVVTVTDLVLNFAEACRALVPALDGAEVPWQDEKQYDNFDRIAEPLFLTLVTEPCAFQAVGEAALGELRLARYGVADADGDAGWIAVDGAARLIGLSSVAAPFDHVLCGEPDHLLPLSNARFTFVYRRSDGVLRRLEAVDLAAR